MPFLPAAVALLFSTVQPVEEHDGNKGEGARKYLVGCSLTRPGDIAGNFTSETFLTLRSVGQHVLHSLLLNQHESRYIRGQGVLYQVAGARF